MNVLKIWKQKINSILNKRDTQINQNFGQNIEYIANQKIENSFDSLSSELNVNIENSNSNVSQYVDTTVNTLSSQINSNISNSNSNLSNYINTSINTLSSQINTNINNSISNTSKYVDNSVSNLNANINNSINNTSSNTSKYVDASINSISSSINTNINNSNSNTSKYVNNSISTLSSQADNTYYKKTGGTITADINLKGNITDRTATPSATQQNAIAFSDKKTGNYICGLNAVYYNNGYIRNRMFLASSLRSSNNGASIDIGVKNDGTIFTNSPHPAPNSNDGNIATTYWVRTLCQNNFVNKSGGTFNGNINIRSTISNYSVIPSSTQQIGISFMDLNSYKTVGGIETILNTVGDFSVNMFTGSKLRNNNSTAYLSVGVKNDGTIFTYAPTANSSSNDQNIANTMWVRNAGAVVTDKSDDTMFGYIKFSSGLIIQGGIIRGTNVVAGNNTLTFKKAFSSTSYIVVFSTGNDKADYQNCRFSGRTSTTYCNYNSPIAGQSYTWIAIGY